jgi:Cu+-exporting ATPase
MTVNPESAAARRTIGDVEYQFCTAGCAEAFDSDPDRYTTVVHPEAGH